MKSNWIWIVLAVLVVLGIVFMLRTRRSPASGSGMGSGGGGEISGTDWTVYGSHNCGWTTKQLAEMDSKNVAYTFVDCDKNPGQCDGMSGFPTLKNSVGELKTGFTPM